MMHHGWSPGFFLLDGLHVLAALAFALGAFFLLAWAIKTLNQRQLKTWGLWLVGGAILLGILVAAGSLAMRGSGGGMRGQRWGGYDRGAGTAGDGSAMMQQGDQTTDGMMDMTMRDMKDKLAGKTGDDFDSVFLGTMIPHHQAAIDMAKEAPKSAKHAEVKTLATAIIAAQQREIDQMHTWQKAWGYTK